MMELNGKYVGLKQHKLVPRQKLEWQLHKLTQHDYLMKNKSNKILVFFSAEVGAATKA